MASPSVTERLQWNLHIKTYLALLSEITGRVVEANELTSLDELASMREALQKLRALPVVAVEIPFSDSAQNASRGLFRGSASPIPRRCTYGPLGSRVVALFLFLRLVLSTSILIFRSIQMAFWLSRLKIMLTACCLISRARVRASNT